jgi:hypothetical protein
MANPNGLCPHCGRGADGVTDPFEEEVPKPGDISICVYCRDVAVFQGDLSLRKMTEEEVAGMEPELTKQLEEARHLLKRVLNARAH